MPRTKQPNPPNKTEARRPTFANEERLHRRRNCKPVLETVEKQLPSKTSLKPGNAAPRDVRRYQPLHELIIPKGQFRAMCKSVLREIKRDFRMQVTALKPLQIEVEQRIIEVFADAGLFAKHANRVSLKPRDLSLALLLRGEEDPRRKKHPSARTDWIVDPNDVGFENLISIKLD